MQIEVRLLRHELKQKDDTIDQVQLTNETITSIANMPVGRLQQEVQDAVVKAQEYEKELQRNRALIAEQKHLIEKTHNEKTQNVEKHEVSVTRFDS